MRPEFDMRDSEIALASEYERWQTVYAKYDRPLVGDILVMPDGRHERVAHEWENGVQPSRSEFGCSLYFGSDGYMSFSGGLDPTIPWERMERNGADYAPVWFFHHGHVQAHNGVFTRVKVRQWKVLP